jgi:O-methyltransferase
MNRRVIAEFLRRLARRIAPGAEAPPSPIPVMPAPEQMVSEWLRGPFDANKAAVLQAALVGERPMAEFVDFVITQLLPRDHKSLFWGDRMLTIDKSAGFLEEPAFQAAFARILGAHHYDQYASPVTIAWRLHTLVWAARVALALPTGDFVECGVFKGDMAWLVSEVTGLAAAGRQFHLYDSFAGFDPSQTTQEDFPELPGFLDYANAIYAADGLWDGVQARFQDMPHIHLHKGYLPDTLDRDGFPLDIAYLHIDLNVAAAEIACLDRLFDRLVPGAPIVFDDYGWKVFHSQKTAADTFFQKRGYHVLELPTGQGLVIKR